MELLFFVIISGLSVAYLIELITKLTESFIAPSLVKLLLTLPLCYLAMWLLGVTGLILVASGPAAAFISLAVLIWVTRLATMQVVNRR